MQMPLARSAEAVSFTASDKGRRLAQLARAYQACGYAERARSCGPAAPRGDTGDGHRGVSGRCSILLPPSPVSLSVPASFQPNQLAASPARTTGTKRPTFRISS